MNLLLNIIKSPEGVSLAESQKVFAQSGGDIGRSDKNAWILADPERYISSIHCSVQFDNGQYYLVDKSTNGTFLNHADEPIGKGKRQPLADGMSFSVGDYEFEVNLKSEPQSQANHQIPGASGPFATTAPSQSMQEPADLAPTFEEELSLTPGFSGEGPVVMSNASNMGAAPIIETGATLDPLQALDDVHRNKSADIPLMQMQGVQQAFTGEQGDHAPLAEQAFTPPSIATNETIPEDWDNTEFGFHSSSTDAGSVVAPPKAKVRAKQPPQKKAVGKKAVKTKKSVVRETPIPGRPAATNESQLAAAVDNNLVEAMGLNKADFSQAQLAQLNQVAGKFVRQTVSGLLKVLRARSTIKNELRLGVTTVQPARNNPIKFSADVDDAMEHLFLRQGKAYLPAISSVDESFDSILAHQIAVLAGMRAAFNSLIKKFDPMELTDRFESLGSAGIFAGNKKLRHWDAYTEFYNSQVRDLDDSFQHLFGEEFVKAYESQLIKLEIARKNEKETQE